MGKYFLIETILLIPSLNAPTRFFIFFYNFAPPQGYPPKEKFMFFGLILTPQMDSNL